MPTVQSILQLIDNTTEQITRSKQNWTAFLRTAAQLYKYPYAEQVMIYAQRPDAKACAEYDLWNRRMGRYVRRGSKGIALIDSSGDRPRLKYVFDISDTGGREHSLRPLLWELRLEHEDVVSDALHNRFGISAREGFIEQIRSIAALFADDYWQDNRGDLLYNIDGSYAAEYDEFNQEAAFTQTAALGITYVTLTRCGFDPEDFIDNVEYLNVFDFNTPNAVNALGMAVSSGAEQLLRHIEVTVKQYDRQQETERSKEHERDHLQAERGLSDSRTDPAGTDGEHRQVREDAEEPPEGAQTGTVQQPAAEREAVPPPAGDRADSAEPPHAADATAHSSPGREREPESERPHAVDGTHEQLQGTGRGNDPDRADLQLNKPIQLSLFPTEEEQRTYIETAAESVSFTPFAFSFAQEEIDHVLRLDSNTDNHRIRIAAEFSKGKTVEENAAFLKELYHGGNGFKVDGKSISAWYADEGIRLAAGNMAQHILSAQVLTWGDAAKRIGELLASGQFATNVEIAEAHGHERLLIAEPLWNLYHDLSESAREQGYLSSLAQYRGGGFPEERQRIADALSEVSTRQTIVEEYAAFFAAQEQDRSLLRFHYHKLQKLWNNLKDLSLPRQAFASNMAELPQVTPFITEDEIDAALCYGSSMAGGKGRIYAYFKEPHTITEKADFLKHEYGIGGRSHAISGATHSGEDHSGKGIRYTKQDCVEVQLNWTAAAKRIDGLIKKDRYLTPDELAAYRTMQEAKLEEAELLSQEEQQTETISETVAVYSGEDNHLPFDVEIRQLRTVKPEQALPDMEEVLDEHPISIQINGEWQTFPNVRAAEEAAYEESKAKVKQNAQNFRIMDDELGHGGAKTKFQANINAIKLLRLLENENAQALPEQQEVLSRYVGWGGLAEAFDPEKENWSKEYAELKELLTPEEYAAARSSTLNAHYTSPVVIKGIYDAIEQMGFRTGNILEPAMGVGNFFGCLPESMRGSRLYGVELDSITGRIAKQLYPKADITIAGFESTDRRDFYDLAIGNVPFGQYQVNDPAYNRLGFSIHDFFFAKTLDQVRPGGVVAFVTSRYTMDKQFPEVRKYIAQRAELLGAIRLPNNAFKANAGTEVVSDILFLQKRDRPIEIEPDWVHLGQNADGFAINSYFIEHPEMVLGQQTSESTQYGKQDFTVAPLEGVSLAEQMSEAVKNIRGTYQEAALPDLGEGEAIDTSIPADPHVKNYSYTVVDGEVYYRENSRMVKPELNATATERVKGMVALRDCVQKLIGQQLDGFISDDTIRRTQADLNELYDNFTAKYGLINSRGNALAFSDDSSYYLLCSLEVLDEMGQLARKADMFTKRTIKQNTVVTSVDTASEALALSIAEKAKVDLPYMAQLTGLTEEKLVQDLQGVIFLDVGSIPPEDLSPVSFDLNRFGYVTADEYLSGNVREKLRNTEIIANFLPVEQRQRILPNIEALRSAQPKDLDASEIEVRLGATWIGSEYIQEFMEELLEPPFYLRRSIQVNFSEFTAEWNISGKSSVGHSDINAYMTYGTERANAYRILEDTLNLRDVRVYDTVQDPDGRERRVLNSKETTLAQQKQQAIKDAFRDWIWKDPDRRRDLVDRYNERFNSLRPREYDGQHIVFSGMNPEISLREHQRNAVAHILYGGNTLLAHEVGAGKTFEMVAAAMESKRLGLCNKALFAVPNHLTEQWASEFLRLYPSANILVATKKDFETRNRKKFCARIATSDYDAVIMGHSQFERIPVSAERQERLLQEQIDEIEEGLSELKASRAERFTIKQLERTKKSLEVRLTKLQNTDRKDDVVTFEELGVDRLYVDEAHSYKNLFLYTKMRNVAGLSTSDAQKSSDMLLKCRYIDEITDGKGIVFATGTPVSNSMTELYTMMRYLQHDMLQSQRLTHFDCWASTFGETQTAIELAPEGTGYRARTRFAKFFNLPELMTLFKEAADIKTADQLNLPTPTPVYHNVVAQPTRIQQEMVQELSERAAKVHAGIVEPSVDNMLKITSDGRKLGLDQRVINPDLPDDPESKVNLCVDNIHRIWEEGQADKLTQLVFCDISTPKSASAKADKGGDKTAGGTELRALTNLLEAATEIEQPFSIYDDIREKLVRMGIPREQIAFIHEANTEVRKKELFAKVRTGQVRVLIGSTFKMGAGMNVQDRFIALHDLDCPWRPGDLEQRSGRIIRQGNRNEQVHIYRYVTEATFDAYLWQTVENKQKFISQIMTSKSPVRSCEDIDETALSYAEIKALCAGDERIKEKMDLDVDVARLRLMKANHQSQQYRLEDSILRTFPEQIEWNKAHIAGLEADMAMLAAHPLPVEGFVGMEVKGDTLTDKDNAGAALLEAFKDAKGLEPVPIGNYRGFVMSLTVEDFGREFVLTLKGQMTHKVLLGKDARGNLIRMENALNAMPERLRGVQERLDNIYAQLEAAKAELGKPFPQGDELQRKAARLAELNAVLNIDDKRSPERLPESVPEAEIAKAPKPSVLQRLNAVPDQEQHSQAAHRKQEVVL